MQYFLFDFDGTLVDSMPIYISTVLRILDEKNVTYDYSIIKTITPLGYLGTARYFFEHGMVSNEKEIVTLMRKYMAEEYRYNIPTKNNVINVLKELKEKGANLNILTASPHSALDVCLKRLGIYELFENIWSCEDFGTTKSDPEIYKMAAEKIGVDVSDVLFLDDNLNADITAKKAGMKVCAVYDKSSEDDSVEMKKISDYYIYDFSELIGLK